MMAKFLILCVFMITGIPACTSLTLEECALTDYVYDCYSKFDDAYFASFTQDAVCMAVRQYIGCLEHIGCECNLTLSYSIGNELTYYHHFYEYLGCIPYTGELNDTKGIPCDKWAVPIDPLVGELLTLEISEGKFVVELDRNCSGFKACYAAYDTEGALAVHNRNLPELCGALENLVVCLETAACGCGGVNQTNIIMAVVNEDQYFRETCYIVPSDPRFARTDIRCNSDGTSKIRTICDTPDPTYKCYTDFQRELMANGTSLPVMCPAFKTYLICVEARACQCGLVRESNVYGTLTSAIAQYNRLECVPETGPLVVNHGIGCPDGSGTRADEDRLILQIAESPVVLAQEEFCGGVKFCYQELDKSNGVALFQKDQRAVCVNSKTFYECLELTYCACGVLLYTNVSWALFDIRSSHGVACPYESEISLDFDCTTIGALGKQCFTDDHCTTVPNTACGSEGVCACARGSDLVANTSCVINEDYGKLSFNCVDNLDCQLVPHSECNENKFCACQIGYRSSNGLCIEVVKGSIGYRCSSGADCTTVANTNCGAGGVCACQTGYMYTASSKQCTPVDGASQVECHYGFIAVLAFSVFLLSKR